jgi:integrase
MGVNLRGSHLFRASNRHGQITQNAFQGSAVGNKLKRHLGALQLSDGKTMHGSRSGCSINLSLIGASDDDVAQHVGWKSLTTAQYYTQTRQVIHTSKTATLLSDDATLATSILPSPASRVGRTSATETIWTISLTYISVYVPADV